MSIAEKLSELAYDLPRVFEAGEKKHTARYKTALVTGDGTDTISFDVPFEPDAVVVTAHGADAASPNNAIRQMLANFRSFWKTSGVLIVRQSGTFMFANISTKALTNYFKTADGVCTVVVPSTLAAPYTSGAQYICIAVRYTDKSDRELLEEEIALLADEGETLEYSSARVLSTVSEEEWQALIASKPNRTFTLV